MNIGLNKSFSKQEFSIEYLQKETLQILKHAYKSVPNFSQFCHGVSKSSATKKGIVWYIHNKQHTLSNTNNNKEGKA